MRQSLLRIILKLCFALEIRGLEHLQAHPGKLILAGNHTGYLDGFLLLSAVNRPFRFLVREEVFSWPLIGRWVRRANIIPLYHHQYKSALSYMINELQRGETLCIFPEGRLTRTGEMDVFKDGTAFLQAKANAPIIPFAISGGFEAWCEGQKLPRFRKIILHFGEPILPDATRNRHTTTMLLKQAIVNLAGAATAQNSRDSLQQNLYVFEQIPVQDVI